MSWEGWYTLAIVLLVLIALIRNWAPPDAAMLGAALMLGIAGVIEVDEVFAGFIKEGLLTVAALFVVAAALRETGALDRIGRWLLGRARTERGALLRMAPWVLTMSAFVNNTPVVAMLVPTVTNWCRQNRVSPSRLLLPVSYLAILGGTCTLIGTSTNLVVNDLMTQTDVPGLEPMSMFELAKLGVPYAIVGSLYLIFVARRFLPNRMDLLEQLGASTRDYLVNMRVESTCPMVGQTVEEANLRRLPGLFLIDITRDERLITPVSPDQVIEAGDIFTFTGVVSTIIDLERIPGLVPVADEGYEARARERRNKTLSEAVISQTSPLVGKTVRDADFRARYNAAVVAVHRGRERMKGRVGDIELRPGDTLLLQATPHFIRAHRNDPHFLVVSGVEEARPARHDRATLALLLMGTLIVLLSLGLSPVLVAFGIAALMVVFRAISVTLARQSIDWQTLITIGAS
ncbi:MAG: SLC13 family permease, partial [Candidatus Hydrogenedentales bacterium]